MAKQQFVCFRQDIIDGNLDGDEIEDDNGNGNEM